jgi:diguanylate cyclase (GGDEF)-like protein/PAS domain S-box-containing protein
MGSERAPSDRLPAPSTSGEFEKRRFAVHAGIALFFVAGATAVLSALGPGAITPSIRTAVFAVGVADLMLGGFGFALRRARWSRSALLAVAVPALGIYGFGNFAVGNPYGCALYLIVIAMWVGISQRRGVSLALAPLYAVAYWVPLWVQPHGPGLNQSVPLVIVVAVASGETIAWLTSRLAAISRANLQASEESFRLLFEQSPLPTMVLDPVVLRFLRVNDAACEHYGYTRAEFLTMTILDVVPLRDDTDLRAGDYLRPGLWQHQTKDKRLIDVEISVNLARLAGVEAFMVVAYDVTEQGLLEDQLRHLALHDTLTGLANRALLEDRLGRALAASTRKAQAVALLSCDLDGFKSVNDRLGHGAGDQVLRQVASRLTDIVRPGDTVARFGADEFAVMIELIDDPGGAQAMAERIIAAVAMPISLDGGEVHLSVSIGIAFGTSTTGAEELSHNADAAKSQAKAAGRNCYRVYEAAMRAKAVRRLELTNDLRAGLDRDEFRLQYQPHVSLAGGRIEGFEALVRWAHPIHGMIQPLDFIALAEESGLIVPLGRWILEAACQEAASWPQPSDQPLTISVNFSARQLRSATLVDDVRTALALSGLAPSRLVIEITESVLMEDTDASTALIEQLKALGIGLAIDDFGTGYSSLSYLRLFDFDILKIDKTFVDALQHRPDQSSAFVRTIVSLGHTLDMQIIAEGIETPAQYQELTELGCDSGQGYLMARPLDPDAALSFLSRSR